VLDFRIAKAKQTHSRQEKTQHRNRKHRGPAHSRLASHHLRRRRRSCVLERERSKHSSQGANKGLFTAQQSKETHRAAALNERNEEERERERERIQYGRAEHHAFFSLTGQ